MGEFLARWRRADAACALLRTRAQRTRFGPAGWASSSPVGAVPTRPVRSYGPAHNGLATACALLSVVEIGVCEDDRYFLAGRMGLFDHGVDIGGDVVPVPGEHLADIDDHVDFLAAVGEGLFGFGLFDSGRVAAMGEADGGAGLHRGPLQQVGGALSRIGEDADTGDVVILRRLNAELEIRCGKRRIQERMIDHLSHEVSASAPKTPALSPSAERSRRTGAGENMRTRAAAVGGNGAEEQVAERGEATAADDQFRMEGADSDAQLLPGASEPGTALRQRHQLRDSVRAAEQGAAGPGGSADQGFPAPAGAAAAEFAVGFQHLVAEVNDYPSADAGPQGIEEQVGRGVAETELAERGGADFAEDPDRHAESGAEPGWQGDAAPLRGEAWPEGGLTDGAVQQSRHADAKSGRGAAVRPDETGDAGDDAVRAGVPSGGNRLFGDQVAIWCPEDSGDLGSAQVDGRGEHRLEDTV